nr:MAG TPA: hypothetical protein [Caudoviricetes sp.]
MLNPARSKASPTLKRYLSIITAPFYIVLFISYNNIVGSKSQ